MPMDIRAYFSKTPPSKTPAPKPLESSSSKGKKSRKRVFIDSDSDEEAAVKNTNDKGKNSSKKSKSNAKDKSEYFEVSKTDVTKLLGKAPVKRIEQPKPKKDKKADISSELIEDIDWDGDADFLEAESVAVSKSAQNGSKESISSQSPSPRKPPSENQQKPAVTNMKLHEMSPSPERDVEPTHSDSPNKNTDSSVEINNAKLKKDVKQSSPKKDRKVCIDKKGYSPPTFKNLPIEKCKSPKVESPEPKKKKTKHEEKKFEVTPKPVHSSPKKTPSEEKQFQLWVDKYKPTSLKQIIGQQGEKSNVNKLVRWLKNWYSNHSGNKKLPRPSPWAKDDSGAYFKAALLSGPPGVGKTTTAHLVCKELEMDVVEFNASDTRSKKLLHEEVSDLLLSKSLSPYATGGGTVSRQHVLVMDEVDGMAGNEDRGGVQELIQLIKSSRIPIICMCNDRNHPKIRSLANYCFDLRFSKPRADQIRGAMMSVCFKEGLKIKPEVLTDVIVNTNQDIRLILNHLSVLAAQGELNMPAASKYVKIGPWDVLRKVFSEEEHKSMSIYDKCDLFFYDYNIAPLFVQENYLNVQPHSKESKTKRGKMELFAKAAHSLACGDLVENCIRSNNAWSLLPVQAIFSSFLPGEYLVGHMGGQINFPAWLGKNSKRAKIDRLTQEVQAHTRLKISGSKEAINLDYSYVLKEKVIRPLLRDGSDGVEESLSILKEYCLLREDLDSLSEITMWPGVEDPFTKLESKVKSAFTRAYNKNPLVTPFSINAAVKKGRGAGTSEEFELEDENLEEADADDEDQDDVTKDAMIMVKKKSAKDEAKGDAKERKKNDSSGSKPRGGGTRGKRGKK